MNCIKKPVRKVSMIRGLLLVLLFCLAVPQQIMAENALQQEPLQQELLQKELLQQEKVILWQTYHRPPGNIKSGQHAGQGFVQLVLEQLTQNLPEYIHKQPITTLARALEDMKQGKNACHPSLFRNPEREQFMVFSQPSVFNAGNHIITRKAVAETLPPGPAELSKLIKDTQLTFVSIKGRSFGTHIDNQLTGLKKNRVVEIPSES